MRVSPLLIMIGCAVVILPLIVVSSFRSRKRKNDQLLKYKKMTGRSTAKITKRNMIRERWHQNMQDEEESYKCIIDYEFIVDGKTYNGHGEGSGAFWKKNSQIICYDPEDPNSNCPKYYYDTKMGKDSGLFAVIVILIIAFIIGIGFMYLKKGGLI